MCFCKRTACGWNLTHTYGFHAEWANIKSKFSLLATHKFHIKYGTATFTSSKVEPSTDSSSAESSLAVSFLGHDGALARHNGDKTNAVLDHYKSNVKDSNMSSFVANLQTDWGVN